ncbi:hypothetical protein, partial [Bacillus cereus]
RASPSGEKEIDGGKATLRRRRDDEEATIERLGASLDLLASSDPPIPASQFKKREGGCRGLA